MEPELFDDNFISDRPPRAVQHCSKIPSNEVQLKAQGAVELLRNKVLSHALGEQGEYEVRTTFTTRQAWRYRCSVLRHGRVLKRAFPPIELDRTRDMCKAAVVTDEMRIAFAAEAVDLHFARCAAVKEYLVLAAIFSEPPQRDYQPLQVTMVVLMGVALAAAYWFWKQPIYTALNLLTAQAPPHMAQWERKEVFYSPLAGEPFTFPLPALDGVSKGAPVEVRMDSANSRLDWIQFNRETLRLNGIAPITEADKTYRLVFLAKADGSSESRLHVYLTIIGQNEPPRFLSLRPATPSSATPRHQGGGGESQFPSRPPSRSPSSYPVQESDCLVKILKGESC
jgi:hypothetical protein